MLHACKLHMLHTCKLYNDNSVQIKNSKNVFYDPSTCTSYMDL